ncbi:MAG: hypothetical protein WCI17_10780 [bacterium]
MALTPSIREQISALWASNRLFCGWFLRPDFVPRTDAELIRCAKMLEQHGDRQTYVTIRKLMKCL